MCTNYLYKPRLTGPKGFFFILIAEYELSFYTIRSNYPAFLLLPFFYRAFILPDKFKLYGPIYKILKIFFCNQ